MTGKDIAFTTGGVVATMVLAYLIYRTQQRDAAAAAAASSAASSAEDQAAEYTTGYQADPYQQAVASLSTQPAITGATTNTTPAVSSSGDTATTGNGGTDVYSEDDFSNMFSSIVSTFAGAITAQSSAPQSVASMTIPTIAGVSSSTLDSIPTTAEEALAAAAANNPIYYSPGGSGPGYYTPGGGPPMIPVSMQTGYAWTSHPVVSHPITQTGY